MKIFVTVKTQARKSSVEKTDETHFKVSVMEIPQDNQANLALVEVLADYFKTSKSKVILISGEKSKEKVFEILK